MHAMIDLETLGTNPDAAIIQVGAVMFDPSSGGTIYTLPGSVFNAYVRVDESNCAVNHDTITWWLGQDAGAARRMADELLSKARALTVVLRDLAVWPQNSFGRRWQELGGVWSHGATFDLPILHSAYTRCGRELPWSYRKARDTRTLYWLKGLDGPPEVDWTGLDPHDALHDAIGQVRQVQAALGIRP